MGAAQADGETWSVDHFAGLDVSVKETSICILDDTGRIVREVKVASEPEALLKVLGKPGLPLQAIAIEERSARYLTQLRVGRDPAPHLG